MEPDPTVRRRIRIATGLSILAHAAILAIPVRERPPRPETLAANLAGPMSVRLAEPPPAVPLPEAPRDTRREAPRKEPVRIERAERAPAREARPILEPPPAPAPSPPLPTFDMAAMIAATRERRRALEAAARGASAPPAAGDPSAAGLQRNLQTLSRGPGTGGIFQILRKGERTAEFAFNGWQGDARRWREVFEVDAGPGGDVELAIVRRMIALIRTHYSGNFNWDSNRLGRVVVLSAAPEDNEGLEDFLLREFFGVPVLKRPR